MRVTVIIANKNYYEFLPLALSSVLNQTYKEYKICVVDASDDFEKFKESVAKSFNLDSSSLVEESNKNCTYFSIDGHDFIHVTIENTFPSNLRNIGIQATLDNTDVYVILDADDEMKPTKIQRIVETIQLSPKEIGVVYADHETLNSVTGEKNIERREPYDVLRLKDECIIHSGAGITKNALLVAKDSFGYYDSTMRTCEDYDLWMRISKKFMIVHLAEVLSLVRVQPQNSTATVSKDTWQRDWVRVHQKNVNKI